MIQISCLDIYICILYQQPYFFDFGNVLLICSINSDKSIPLLFAMSNASYPIISSALLILNYSFRFNVKKYIQLTMSTNTVQAANPKIYSPNRSPLFT